VNRRGEKDLSLSELDELDFELLHRLLQYSNQPQECMAIFTTKASM